MTLVKPITYGPIPTTTTWTAGRYYSGLYSTSSTTGTLSVQRLTVVPIWLPAPRTVDRIGLEVTTAGGAGTLARLGLYLADPSTRMATTRLLDAGTVDVTTTGVKQATISQSLPEGLSYLAVIASGGTFRAAQASSYMPMYGGAGAAVNDFAHLVFWDNAAYVVGSALPTTLPTPSGYASGVNPPMLMVRAA